ncbi:MAG: DUF1540 domain-containing protein [Oscillospiraceae bacterium]|nr:DUF1540 domain-containing protein [Oscillospiraceae bacterium]
MIIDNNNPSVNCNVTNCVHNKNGCTCTAKNIKVGPQFAVTTGDTKCQSFKQN